MKSIGRRDSLRGTDRQGDLAEFIAHFQHRVLQDALTEATSSYWLRRSSTFAAVGTAACDVIALACRNRAAVSYFQDDSDHPCCRRLEAS